MRGDGPATRYARLYIPWAHADNKSPVDVVVVVAGAALPVEVRPGVLRGRRSVVRLQAVEVDERFVVSQPRAREE